MYYSSLLLLGFPGFPISGASRLPETVADHRHLGHRPLGYHACQKWLSWQYPSPIPTRKSRRWKKVGQESGVRDEKAGQSGPEKTDSCLQTGSIPEGGESQEVAIPSLSALLRKRAILTRTSLSSLLPRIALRRVQESSRRSRKWSLRARQIPAEGDKSGHFARFWTEGCGLGCPESVF